MEKTMYKVKIEFTEPMLGTVPKNEEVFTTHVAKKVLALSNGEELLEEEKKTLPEAKDELEKTGYTGHHKDEEGLFIYDFMVRGFFKAAAQALKPQSEVKAYKSHIDQQLFVFPRRIHFLKNEKPISKPDGILERPLRAMTQQGPRVALAKSDFVNAGATLEFKLVLLPGPVKESHLKSWIEYGELSGLGQFRNGSYGRFSVLSFEKQG